MQDTGRLYSPWRPRARATAPSHNKIVRSITITHTTNTLFHSPAPAVFRIRHGTRETREFAAGKAPHARRVVAGVTAVRQVFCLVYESMRIITRIEISSIIIYAVEALVGEKDVLQMNWQISHSSRGLHWVIAVHKLMASQAVAMVWMLLALMSSLKLTICRRDPMW